MGDEASEAGEKPKKVVRRKPLWLLVPVGQREVQRAGEAPKPETLYTLEQFTSITDLRKNLEARELDQTNAKGIVLFRADAIPVETKMKAQVVFKFSREDEETVGTADGEEEGMV